MDENKISICSEMCEAHIIGNACTAAFCEERSGACQKIHQVEVNDVTHGGETMMRMRSVTVFGIALIMVLLTLHSAFALGGSGTEIDPYQLTTCNDLQLVGRDNASAFYKVMNPIDCSETSGWVWDGGAGFIPIGMNRYVPDSWDFESMAYDFTGTFDGDGKAISGVYIESEGRDGTGLFMSSSGVIKDVVIDTSSVVQGTTGFDTPYGMLVGLNNGLVDNCSVSADVNWGHIGKTTLGGVVGWNGATGVIANSSFVGNIQGREQIGGIAGLNDGVITGCDADVQVYIRSSSPQHRCGGLVGMNTGSISRSFTSATSLIDCGSVYLGGLVSWNTGSITDSYSLADVVPAASAQQGGGLVGANYGVITNCYSTGVVSLAAGKLQGGLVAVNAGTVTGSYWDNETSNESTSAAGVGKTTAEMQLLGTFVDWDFTHIWNFVAGNYPMIPSDVGANVKYVNFDGGTNFFAGADNLVNPVLELTTSGKIVWVGSGLNFTNADFDSYVELGDEYIYVDSASLPADVNTSANLTVYKSFSLPKILVDGVVCSDCEVVSGGAEIVFNVMHFSNYTVENGTVDLLSPANFSMISNMSEAFTFYVNATSGVTGNCTVYIDNATVATYSDVNGTESRSFSNETLLQSLRGDLIVHDWYVGCTDVSGTIVSVRRTFMVTDWVRETASAPWSGRTLFGDVVFNNTMYVMGGQESISYLNDVWSSTNGVNWSLVSNGSWPIRAAFRVVVFNDSMWLFGGQSGTGRKNDVWSSADGGVSWVQHANASWTARTGHSVVVYDDKIWVMGGNNGTRVNDVWYTADGETWTAATMSANWTAGGDGQAVVFNGAMYLLGRNTGGGRMSDVWSSTDGVNWILVKANSSVSWMPRYYHDVVVANGKMWLTGGNTLASSANTDVWMSSDGANWYDNGTAEWSKRNQHKMMVLGSKIYLMGGSNGTTSHRYNDVWSLDVGVASLFNGTPNVTAPTTNQVVRGTEVNVTLGSRESNERINIAVNSVNVVANNTNTSQLDFTVTVPAGDVNVTVSSDDVGGEGNASEVTVPIKVSTLGAVVTVTTDASAYWLGNATPRVTAVYSGDSYTVPLVQLTLMNGSDEIRLMNMSSEPSVVYGGLPTTRLRAQDCDDMGQTFNATGDYLTDFQFYVEINSAPVLSNAGAIKIYKWYNESYKESVANYTASTTLRATPFALERGQMYFIEMGRGYYATYYGVDAMVGQAYFCGGYQLADAAMKISIRDSRKFVVNFSGIADSFPTATFVALVNDTLFEETGVSSAVEIDALVSSFFMPLNLSIVRGIFSAQVTAAEKGLASPTYVFETNVTGSWVGLNVSGQVTDSLGEERSHSLTEKGPVNWHYYTTFSVTEPVFINYFDVVDVSKVRVDGIFYPVVDGKAYIGKVFVAGVAYDINHPVGYEGGSCGKWCVVPGTACFGGESSDQIFSWTAGGGGIGFNYNMCYFHGVNYTTMDKVNVTVNPGTVEGSFNMRVRATDGTVTTNNSISGGLQLLLDPELGAQFCQALTYPNAENLPSTATVPVDFVVYAPLGFSGDNANATLTRGSHTSTASCSGVVIDSTHKNYTCSVPINYYYAAGDYTFTVRAHTSPGKNVNATVTGQCSVGSLLSSRKTPSGVSFPTASPGVNNAQSTPLYILNVGNVALDIGMIAHDLIGRQNAGVKINASLIKVGESIGSAVTLTDSVQQNVTMLAPGLNANATLYFWLSMPSTQQVQDYYSQTPWTVVTEAGG